MKNHKWSQQDCDLLEKNVKEYGLTLGCKKTADEIYVTEKACVQKYYNTLWKFKKSGIKVDHPEIAKKAKVVEEKKKRQRIVWKKEEIDLLKRNVEKYGSSEGSRRTSVSTGRTFYACRFMLGTLRKNGFSYKSVRNNISNEQEIELAEYLKVEIAKNPNNLMEVFRSTANKFGFKHVNSVKNRWYGSKVGKQDYSTYPSCRDNIGHIYSVVGTNSTINGKNQAKPDVKKTGWILAIFKKWRNKNKK